jgi:hypothetical protein
MQRTATFSSPRSDPVSGRTSVTGRVRNPKALVGQLAAKAAKRLGLKGYEIISRHHPNTVIDPDTPFEEMQDSDFVLSPEYTPAAELGV